VGKFIPVEPEKWAEMVKAQAEVARLEHLVNYWKVEAETDNARWLRVLEENERLKAEVERLTELNSTLALRYDATKSMLDGCAKEIEEMEAEVERLTSENESLQAKATNIYNAMVVRCKVEEITHKANADSIISQGMMSEAMKMMEESVAIREQVERLTKAGDVMAIMLQYDEVSKEWNAAKKGGQP